MGLTKGIRASRGIIIGLAPPDICIGPMKRAVATAVGYKF